MASEGREEHAAGCAPSNEGCGLQGPAGDLQTPLAYGWYVP